MLANPQKRISFTIPSDIQQTFHNAGINAIVKNYSDGSIWTGGRDAVLINTTNGPLRSKIYHGHSDWINDVVLKDGIAYTASNDRSIRAWIGNDSHRIGLHSDYAKCLANPRSRQNIVISGGLDRKIIVWDIEDRKSSLLTTSSTGIYSLSSSPSGNTVVFGGPGGLVKLLDPRIKQTEYTGLSLTGHKDTVKSILLHDTSHTIITASADSMCKVWDIRYVSIDTYCRNRACVSTLGFDSPIWTLYAPLPQNLDIFWLGCRDGSVIKVARGSSRIATTQNTRSIHEGYPDGCISSPMISNRPSDRPLSVIMVPKSLPEVGGKFQEIEGVDCILVARESNPVTGICGCVDGESIWVSTTSPNLNKWSDLSIKNSLVVSSISSKFLAEDNPMLIPAASIIRQNTAFASEAELNIFDAGLSTEQVDADEEPTPLYIKPIESIAGGECLIKYAFLNDRRRVAVLDSAGTIEIWDIIQCNKLKQISHGLPKKSLQNNAEFEDAAIYGISLTADQLFDKVVAASNTLVWVAKWCTVDLRIGSLMIHLDEYKCFDAESYYEDCGLKPLPGNEDLRINLGRWALTNLFIKYTERLYTQQADLVAKSPIFNVVKSSTEATPAQLTYSPQRIDSTSPTIQPQRESMASTPQSSPSRPAAILSFSTSPNQTINRESDASRPVTPNSAGFMGRLKGHIRSRSADAKIWKRKKKTDDEGGSSDEDELSFSNDGVHSLVPPPRNMEPDNAIERLAVAPSKHELLRNLIPHFSIEDTPLTTLPSPLSIAISHEESSDACVYQDLLDCTVGGIGTSDFDSMKRNIPLWVSDYIVHGKPISREPVKISFLLAPYEGSKLKELPNGASRLSANRMLRIRKLLGYIYDRVVVDDNSNEGATESAQDKAERLLEILCQGIVLDRQTTLASLKFMIWKGGGELELRYRKSIQA